MNRNLQQNGDLSSELHRLTSRITDPESLSEVLADALQGLRAIIPYDIAVLFELEREVLVARAIRGPLATEVVSEHTLRLDTQPAIRRALAQKWPIAQSETDHAHDGDPFDDILNLPHGHSCMVVPLHAGDNPLGVVTLDRAVCEQYSERAVELAAVYGQIISVAMSYARQTRLLQRYRRQLQEENRLLREEVSNRHHAQNLVEDTLSPSMRAVVDMARRAARSDIPILIGGETGTGKEVLAHAIHGWSDRAGRPFVKLNCAAIPDNLVESELFGHIKGAFSGAHGDRPGRFLTADGGTLFLDEVGDMPLAVQAKLLRVLQEGTFEPLGSDRTIEVDVRVIAATHLDLQRLVENKRFRQDLYYRLAVFPVTLPPLRDRADDIARLAGRILDRIRQRRRDVGPWTVSADAMAALRGFSWPGNVRQLVNTLERATILQPSGEIRVEHLGLQQPTRAPEALMAPPPKKPILSFREHECQLLRRALAQTGGKIYGDDGAAALLDLKPTTLQSKLRKHGLR